MLCNNFIREKIILPCSDLLTGQYVNKYLHFLLETQLWSREQIDEFQNKRLKLLISHAYTHVPFYREEMDRLKLKPSDIITKADLYKLPIITKSLIKDQGVDRFTAKNIPSRQIIKNSSSGSTGEPFHFMITKEAYSVNIAANLRGWYGTGWRLGDKYIKLSQKPRKNWIKKIQDSVTNNLYLTTDPLTDENFEDILKRIEIYKPKVIRCYPDPLLLLARYKCQNPNFYSPAVITTTGSTLYPETRKEIEDAFGCKIFDSYSCEGNSCVFECPTHSCYHSSEEYGISEVIDESGNLVTKGIGRLITTDLWNMVHPFIRYDTQDLVEIDDTPCVCGRKHLKILRILGRDNEVLVMPSGRRFIIVSTHAPMVMTGIEPNENNIIYRLSYAGDNRYVVARTALRHECIGRSENRLKPYCEVIVWYLRKKLKTYKNICRQCPAYAFQLTLRFNGCCRAGR